MWPATHIDPKIQGISFFYAAPANSGVRPGMNVLCRPGKPSRASRCRRPPLSGGRIGPGSISVPSRTSSCASRSQPTCRRRTGGYIVAGMPHDVQIVTGGAQLLLSEEFRSQIQVDEDD
jgi:hypothetical protein